MAQLYDVDDNNDDDDDDNNDDDDVTILTLGSPSGRGMISCLRVNMSPRNMLRLPITMNARPNPGFFPPN